MNVASHSKLIVAVVFAAYAQAYGGVCSVAKTQFGLLPYFVEPRPNMDYATEIKRDFDGDGTNDVLRWVPQDAGSTTPADYASVTVTMSSSSKSFTLEETYVGVLLYRNRYYVITTNLPNERQQRTSIVYSVVPSGFRRLCTIAQAERAR